MPPANASNAPPPESHAHRGQSPDRAKRRLSAKNQRTFAFRRPRASLGPWTSKGRNTPWVTRRPEAVPRSGRQSCDSYGGCHPTARGRCGSQSSSGASLIGAHPRRATLPRVAGPRAAPIARIKNNLGVFRGLARQPTLMEARAQGGLVTATRFTSPRQVTRSHPRELPLAEYWSFSRY